MKMDDLGGKPHHFRKHPTRSPRFGFLRFNIPPAHSRQWYTSTAGARAGALRSASLRRWGFLRHFCWSNYSDPKKTWKIWWLKSKGNSPAISKKKSGW